MKKRLRKKFHRGEFAEFGFEVSFRLRHSEEGASSDTLWDQFIDQIESQGLEAGGGGSEEGGFEYFISAHRRRTAVTDDHRLKLEEWLTGNPAIADPQVRPLVDAWDPVLWS